jgi:hypothetical protein
VVDADTERGLATQGSVICIILRDRQLSPLASPHALALAGSGDHEGRLMILQATSSEICVVHNPLKLRRRGFDDSSSSAKARF